MAAQQRNFGGTGFGQSQGNVRSLDQLTQEVRLASDGDSPFKWQIGGMYFDSRDITEFYQRAYLPQHRRAQPEQLGAAA